MLNVFIMNGRTIEQYTAANGNNPVPVNTQPTCYTQCTCSSGGSSACSASNCSSDCGRNIKNTGGAERNCVTFCPVINCDG